MGANNGSGAWGDLLRFNNRVGGQMNCQDGNYFYLKPEWGENVQTGNMLETQSFSGTACTKYLGLGLLGVIGQGIIY